MPIVSRPLLLALLPKVPDALPPSSGRRGRHAQVAMEDVELADGRARIVGVPDSGIAIGRVAAATHWHPAGLPDGMSPGLYETALLNPGVLDAPDGADGVTQL